MVFTSMALCRACSIQRLEAGKMPKGMTLFIHHTHVPPTVVSGEIRDKVDQTLMFLPIVCLAPTPDGMLAIIRLWEGADHGARATLVAQLSQEHQPTPGN